MARHNEILAGRYNRFLQKVFGMKGGAVAPQLASEIAPAFPLFSGAENRYLEGWDRFAARISQVAVAAAFGQLRLRNPSGANVVAIIEKLRVLNIGAATDQPFMSLGPQAADLATISAYVTQRFDPRGRPNPALISSQTTAGAAFGGTIYDQMALPINTFGDFIVTDIQEFQILPGDAVTIGSGVANQLLVAHCWWRERFLEDSERA